jgi:hypothetical protein
LTIQAASRGNSPPRNRTASTGNTAFLPLQGEAIGLLADEQPAALEVGGAVVEGGAVGPVEDQFVAHLEVLGGQAARHLDGDLDGGLLGADRLGPQESASGGGAVDPQHGEQAPHAVLGAQTGLLGDLRRVDGQRALDGEIGDVGPVGRALIGAGPAAVEQQGGNLAAQRRRRHHMEWLDSHQASSPRKLQSMATPSG